MPGSDRSIDFIDDAPPVSSPNFAVGLPREIIRRREVRGIIGRTFQRGVGRVSRYLDRRDPGIRGWIMDTSLARIIGFTR